MLKWIPLTLGCIQALFANPPSRLESWDASEYAKHSSTQETHFERFFDLNSLFGCRRILDVGSGSGKITTQIADFIKQGEVIGIDSLQDMVEFASKTYPPSKHKNLHFQQLSAESFQFDKPFDYILSIHTMHWIKEQKKALKNIYKHLASGGKFFSLTAASKEGLPFDRALKKTTTQWNAELKHFKSNQVQYDVETYRFLLIEAGFHVDAMHLIFTENLHQDRACFSHYLKQWLPQYKALSNPSKEPFLEKLVDHYLDESKQNQKNAPIIWGEYLLIVKASKKE